MAKAKHGQPSVATIVKLKMDMPAAGFDLGMPKGSVGIVTKLDRDREPYVQFELSGGRVGREVLLHWTWLEIVG